MEIVDSGRTVKLVSLVPDGRLQRAQSSEARAHRRVPDQPQTKLLSWLVTSLVVKNRLSVKDEKNLLVLEGSQILRSLPFAGSHVVLPHFCHGRQ